MYRKESQNQLLNMYHEYRKTYITHSIMTKTKEKTTHHPVDADEVLRTLGPLGQLDVSHVIAVVKATQLVPVHVGEHLRQAEEFGNQLLFMKWF